MNKPKANSKAPKANWKELRRIELGIAFLEGSSSAFSYAHLLYEVTEIKGVEMRVRTEVGPPLYAKDLTYDQSRVFAMTHLGVLGVAKMCRELENKEPT